MHRRQVLSCSGLRAQAVEFSQVFFHHQGFDKPSAFDGEWQVVFGFQLTR
jgi:hypothetical protein